MLTANTDSFIVEVRPEPANPAAGERTASSPVVQLAPAVHSLVNLRKDSLQFIRNEGGTLAFQFEVDLDQEARLRVYFMATERFDEKAKVIWCASNCF
jgi:hypothetical protein